MENRVTSEVAYKTIATDPDMAILITKTGDEVLIEGDCQNIDIAVELIHAAYMMMIHELFATWTPAIHYLDETEGDPV